MSREFLTSPLLSHPMPTPLTDRILEILRRRSPFEQAMTEQALRFELRRWLADDGGIEFQAAIDQLAADGLVDVDMIHGLGPRQGRYYTATAKRAAQTETIIGDDNAD